MPKIKIIKSAIDCQNLSYATKLLEVAKSSSIIELLNILNINYSVIGADGNYIIQNNAMVVNISKGEIKAQIVDTHAWADCQEVMQAQVKKIVEEEFNERYYLSIKYPVVSNGTSIGIIILSFDITEKKRAELAKDAFLANMGHDLRMPFSGIFSVADYLYQKENEPLKKELLGNIIQSSKSFLTLLDQILESSRSYDEMLKHTYFNIQTEINQVVSMFSAKLKAKNLSLSIDCPEVFITTNQLKLSKVLLNLLGNAIKFTESGSIHVCVSFNPTLAITIKDTGIGISAEHLQYIFEKSYKITPSYQATGFNGSGLGLYIVRETVKELGGFVTVESELDKGSCFTVVLPVKAAAQAES